MCSNTYLNFIKGEEVLTLKDVLLKMVNTRNIPRNMSQNQAKQMLVRIIYNKATGNKYPVRK